MKLNTSIIRRLLITAAALASVSVSEAVNRTLILLQENSNGTSYMSDVLEDGATRDVVDQIIDTAIESTEALAFQGRAQGKYQRFVNLTDTNCTRANLLNQLIKQSKEGYTVDLAILGHGSKECLMLHGTERLTGRTTTYRWTRIYDRYSRTYTWRYLPITDQGSIRTLLTDARAREGSSFNFKLRLVHMCNCYGATTNDDWLAIGAETSVGAPMNNYMPEPMISDFWTAFLKDEKRVSQAASESLSKSKAIYYWVPGYHDIQANGYSHYQETQQTVSGNGNLIFRDEYQLDVGQSKSFYVYARRTHNFPQVYLVAGQTYTFSASTTDTWSNLWGLQNPNANGYARSSVDVLRYNTNVLKMIGERFRKPNSAQSNFISGSAFSVGTSRTLTAPGHGFLNLFANDNIFAYGDNGGVIRVTVKRTN